MMNLWSIDCSTRSAIEDIETTARIASTPRANIAAHGPLLRTLKQTHYEAAVRLVAHCSTRSAIEDIETMRLSIQA